MPRPVEPGRTTDLNLHFSCPYRTTPRHALARHTEPLAIHYTPRARTEPAPTKPLLALPQRTSDLDLRSSRPRRNLPYPAPPSRASDHEKAPFREP
jgi:hypothetical protein